VCTLYPSSCPLPGHQRTTASATDGLHSSWVSTGPTHARDAIRRHDASKTSSWHAPYDGLRSARFSSRDHRFRCNLECRCRLDFRCNLECRCRLECPCRRGCPCRLGCPCLLSNWGNTGFYLVLVARHCGGCVGLVGHSCQWKCSPEIPGTSSIPLAHIRSITWRASQLRVECSATIGRDCNASGLAGT